MKQPSSFGNTLSNTPSIPSEPKEASVAEPKEIPVTEFKQEDINRSSFGNTISSPSALQRTIDVPEQDDPVPELERKDTPAAEKKEGSFDTPSTSQTVDLDEAASLWFQYETLKSQYAQMNARFHKANEDIAFYKRQLESLDATTRQKLTAAKEEKDEGQAPAENSQTVDLDEAATLWFQYETLKTQYAQMNARFNKANEDIEFYKRQLELLDTSTRENLAAAEKKNEENRLSFLEKSNTSSGDLDEAASLWFQCETLKTQYAQINARLNRANEDIAFYKRQLEHLDTSTQENLAVAEKKKEEQSASVGMSSDQTVNLDEAASLWFQCETLKTQYAQINARLNRANEDIVFYKRQLEHLDTSAQENLAAAAEERDREVRGLTELIVKQDKLLGEYETNLENLRKSRNEENNAEIEALCQELTGLYKTKDEMQSAITALKAELEMSHSQMQLMMVVSTEIQNEFESYKRKMDFGIKEMLAEKQQEHQKELEALEQKHTTEKEEMRQREPKVSVHSASDESLQEMESLRKKVFELIGTVEEKDRESKRVAAERENTCKAVLEQVSELKKIKKELSEKENDLIEEKDRLSRMAAAERENTLKIVLEQVSELKKLNEELCEKEKAVASSMSHNAKTIKSLQDQVTELNKALEHKDQTIAQMEKQMHTQKTGMEAQIMDLTQSILEKDAQLLEYANQQVTREPITVTQNSINANHQPQDETKHQASHVRNYMYTTSSDEEAYSTDEEEHDIQPAEHSFSKSLSPELTHTPHVESSDEEDKQQPSDFSYSSTLSRSVLSLHSSSSTLANTVTQDDPEDLKRSSISSHTLSPSEENSTTSWPVPPPTPPPSEPLPPLPMSPSEHEDGSKQKETPVIRRGRSKTMIRGEAPSPFTTSIHQTNELARVVTKEKPVPPPRKAIPVPPPRKENTFRNSAPVARKDIPVPPPRKANTFRNSAPVPPPRKETTFRHSLPLSLPRKESALENSMPVPPPRKEITKPVMESLPAQTSLPMNTKWMDDPESEEEAQYL
jgi:chromosome segregation ATPase